MGLLFLRQPSASAAIRATNRFRPCQRFKSPKAASNSLNDYGTAVPAKRP
jgi:hypothetical protein